MELEIFGDDKYITTVVSTLDHEKFRINILLKNSFVKRVDDLEAEVKSLREMIVCIEDQLDGHKD